MKSVVLAQPHQSVTKRQSRFTVLCIALLTPLETSTSKHTLNDLSGVQKGKGKDKNTGSIKHWSLWLINMILHSWFTYWEIVIATSLQDLVWDKKEWEARGSEYRRQHHLGDRTFLPGPEEQHQYPQNSFTCLPPHQACLGRSLRSSAFFSSMNYLHDCKVFCSLEEFVQFSF